MPTNITRGSMSAKAFGLGSGATNLYAINQSLRFRSSASACLYRTFSTAQTNATLQTVSFWVKRGALGSQQLLFTGFSGSGFSTDLQFDAADTLSFEIGSASYLTTTQVFRDPSAWYHIVLKIDTGQATAANRAILWVNGVQVSSFSATNYPALNANSSFGINTANNYIASNNSGTTYFFDGYLTEFYFLDGTALTASSFGAFDSNGVWQPISYSGGNYGNNGFYLNFGDETSTTTIGYDYSGKGNNWSTLNISLATVSTTSIFSTAGTTYWTVPQNVTTASYTIVGGGGGGGSNYGGGGGGGGRLSGTLTGLISGDVFTLNVAAGGSRGVSGSGLSGGDGGTTTVSDALGYVSLSAAGGGGGGGAGTAYNAGRNGTSGGGSVYPAAAGTGIVGVGNNGGTGSSLSGGGGGGGILSAGGNGLNFITGASGGAGGNGALVSYTGFSAYVGGGGGGGGSNSGGSGGNGGGNGGTGSSSGGTGGYGGGGGGGGGSGAGGFGGSGGAGVVVFNYATYPATYDSMNDSPTGSTITTGNYCVFNPLNKDYGTYSDGNLTFTGDVTNNANAYGSVGVTGGNYYWEIKIKVAASSSIVIGFNSSITGTYGVYDYGSVGSLTIVSGSYNFFALTGDVVGVALNATTQTVSWYLNGVLKLVATYPTQTGNTDIITPWVQTYNYSGVADAVTGNFGQQPLLYPVAGYFNLNTYNISAPAISNGAQYFAASLYTGTGSGQVVTDGLNNAAGTTFQPDFVWNKSRSGAYNNTLTDSSRGTNAVLFSQATTAQSVSNANGWVSSLNTNGFTTTGGATNAQNVSLSAATYVAWLWKANSGVTTTNSDGTIQSTIQVNKTAGFSIVLYTSTGANATVGHGLGAIPSLIIFKNYASATTNWPVYHYSAGAGSYLLLNTSAVAVADATMFNSIAPTSTTFSVGSNVNLAAGTTLAYCFASIPGYSYFSAYTGNGLADGPFVYCGFRPRFVLIKSSSVTAANWFILDTSRSAYNVTSARLFPSTAGVEVVTPIELDILSNGFKVRVTAALDAGTNTSGSNYIFAAFAENPFNSSRAR